MRIKPIKTKRDYKVALKRMEILWGAKSGTPHGNELDALATLVHNYEQVNFPMDSDSDKLDQLGKEVLKEIKAGKFKKIDC
jgi:antitoxin component HigA of HigAB toxin-antitoxin module